MEKKRQHFLEESLAKYHEHLANVKIEPDNDIDLFSQGLSSVKQKIRAWQVSTDTGYFLRDRVVSEKPKKILEIGTSMGYSTAFLAWGNEINGNRGHIYTNDILPEKITRAKKFHESLVLENINYILGDTLEIIPELPGDFDMIFFDGYKPAYTEYFKMLEKKWSVNGIIIIDNAGDFPDRMQDFLEYLETRDDLHIEFNPVGDGLLVIRRGKNSDFLPTSLLEKSE